MKIIKTFILLTAVFAVLLTSTGYNFYTEYYSGPPFINISNVPNPEKNIFVNTITGITVLLDSSGAGGFELGSTFSANGWTAVNDTANIWRNGNQVKYRGNYGAYVSRSFKDTNSYNKKVNQVSHFYRDIFFLTDKAE